MLEIDISNDLGQTSIIGDNSRVFSSTDLNIVYGVSSKHRKDAFFFFVIVIVVR